MSYDEWINSIEILTKKNDEIVKNKLINEEFNSNLQKMLEPKLVELIKNKFNKCIDRIIISLDEIIDDNNALDLALTELKKKVKFIVELLNIKELSEEKRNELYEMLVEESDNVYNILLKNVRENDTFGILEQTIKNNRIKWS